MLVCKTLDRITCISRGLAFQNFRRRWHSPHPGGQVVESHGAGQGDHRVLKVDATEGVLTLTLNRPEKRNALNRSLLEALKTELEQASKIPKEVRAIVIQSEGGAVFSSGHDLKELVSFNEQEQRDLFLLCSDVMQLLPSMPQPTIGAVEGLATAAGCQLVAACDLVVGHPRSGYSTPGATTIGLFCHTPAVSLVRSIGIKRATDMLFTGRTITAPEAMQYGLISHTAANPHREAAKLAQQIASQSSCAIQAGKRSLYKQASAESLEAAYIIATEAMLENLQTKDVNKGIDAFLKKEPIPNWKHE